MQVTTDRNTCMFCGGKALQVDDYYECNVCKMQWIDRNEGTGNSKTSG